ncbi:MAG TPA: class I SAM-dependent methyltransferase [Gammaproteobacteria bacterium]|nr:class I SAM-dependent methyltransferase [Gammaproteobacteria bacterium]
MHHKRETCRGCNGTRLQPFLRLGPQPLANAFLRNSDEFAGEESYPLDVYFCETCSLVQLLDVIDPSVLFRNYIYVTGTSDTIARHNEDYAATVVDYLNLESDSLVVEVASNDGSLLKCFQAHGVRTLGVEPATNIAEMARAAGIETVNEFFNHDTARQLRESHGAASAVIGNNVMAHVDDTQDFLRGARHLLKSDGLVIIEVPYLGEFMERLEYDTVYHEHLCYFSITALLRLCDEVGLSMVRIDRVPVHGGSLRMYAGSSEHYSGHAEDVLAAAAGEVAAGLTGFARYAQFASDVEANRTAIRGLLSGLKEQGKTVAGYGAPAKGNTLLNYCGIDTGLLPYTVDKSAMKVGLYTPGMHIPVLPVETLLDKQPDYVMILAWNFAEEIMNQQAEYKRRGGMFIIPLPDPKVV